MVLAMLGLVPKHSQLERILQWLLLQQGEVCSCQ
jgi:hypothetical protein